MIDLKRLERDEAESGNDLSYREKFRQSLKNRGEDPGVLDQILDLNKQRKSWTTQFEQAKAEQNSVGQDIAQKKKNKEDASDLLNQMQEVSKKSKEAHQRAEEVQEELNELLMRVPNVCHPETPVGSSEEDNVEVRIWGDKPQLAFEPKDHVAIGENLDIIDFERAGKVTGSRFAILKGQAARLERALIQFMMDTHSKEHGYLETIPPYIVNSQSLRGTSQLPKFQEDLFHLVGTDYHLVPTAEVPVTNYHAGEMLQEQDLPIRYVAFSPCFRSEAGSYGRDTKGLIRQHQFNKVELMVFAHPDKSYEVHEQLTAHAESILQKLELPYRTVALCTGDIGFGAAKCYDVEVWLPGQNQYREISSCSNFEDFQARRANIRFRPDGKGKPQFVHTLNGSGLAVGRTLIAILENYQKEDGTFEIPQTLKPYM